MASWKIAEDMLLERIHPKKVAKILNLPENDVYRRAKKLGVSPLAAAHERAEDVREGLTSGRYRTYQEAADANGITRQGVYYIVRKAQ